MGFCAEVLTSMLFLRSNSPSDEFLTFPLLFALFQLALYYAIRVLCAMPKTCARELSGGRRAQKVRRKLCRPCHVGNDVSLIWEGTCNASLLPSSMNDTWEQRGVYAKEVCAVHSCSQVQHAVLKGKETHSFHLLVTAFDGFQPMVRWIKCVHYLIAV